MAKHTNKGIGIKTFRKNFPLTLLALPAVLFMFVFNYIPLYGLVLPFKKYDYSLGFFKSPWAGLENFKFLLDNEAVALATRNTILYNVAFIILGTAMSVLIALMLYEMRSGYVKTYQTFLFLPHFISWVVAAYAAKVFLDIDFGMINKFLVSIGKETVAWYNKPGCWPYILIIAEIWKGMGYNAIIYYAALTGTDKSLFEAASIDGAGKLKQIWYISLPSIKPMIIIMTILKIGRIFYGDFGLFYNFTLNSSLLYSTTDIVDTYVYRSLITLGDIGMSSAAGFYQAVLGFILVVTTNWIVNKIDSDNALF